VKGEQIASCREYLTAMDTMEGAIDAKKNPIGDINLKGVHRTTSFLSC